MRVKLKTVSHRFEAEMIKELLKEIDVSVYVVDHNGSENMDIYLGYESEGVELFVDEEHLEDAKLFLDATPDSDETIEFEQKIKFPYWIVGGFLLMLIIFIVYNL